MGGRRPTKAVPVLGGRHLAAVETPRDDVRISWRLGSVDTDGRRGWYQLDKGTALYLHNKLASFESMTWGELAASTNHKQIPVENLCAAAQQRLVELRRDDLGDLWELRLGGKQRVWGWRSGDVMNLLWWDPEHEVCPSSKKHT